MKIVHIITRLVQGGADENTVITCNLQVARGHEVWLVHGRDVAPGMMSQIDDRVVVLCEPSLVREISPRQDMQALLGLTRTVRELAPDVVHTHTSKAGILGRVAARRCRAPIVLHGVHILPFQSVSRAKRWLYRGLEAAVAPATDAFICVSRGMRDSNLAAGLGNAENNHIVYSGMDLARFETALPAESLPQGRIIVLAAAFEARKRQEAFLDVFAALARRHPDIRLALLGQGECEPVLRAKVARLGLDARVHFLGFRRDVERWIAGAEICVLPSMREGLPRVVIQYVAVGRPTVVTALPGIDEVVTDGENGFVVQSGRVEDMEAPLEQLLGAPDLTARMAEAARRRDMSKWSAETMVDQIESIMARVSVRKGLASARLSMSPT
ncbi:hypothetical protein LCGC14_1199080 [marine sediment metagenome]|uniref:Glycosyltransferase subfamily 4-like N-terminal domain-containing protein n=1 Tax=marine sediment metagenome TaxID=412755 RepID=A0A0F9LHI4_9ZZZZ